MRTSRLDTLSPCMLFLVLIAYVVFVESVGRTPAVPDGVEKQADLSPVTPVVSVKTGIIIPLYVAADSSSWDDVIAMKHQYPSLPIIVIVNSGDNPGTVDPAYMQRIDMLASSGITVLGYVSTDKGQLALDQVLQSISRWGNYSASVSGVMLDEMSRSDIEESLYANYSAYARSLGLAYVMGNPKTDVTPTYLQAVDNVVVCECEGWPPVSTVAGGWHANYSKAFFSLLVHSIPQFDGPDSSAAVVLDLAPHVAYMYVTNDTNFDMNPWDTLSPYLTRLAAILDAFNAKDLGTLTPKLLTTFTTSTVTSGLPTAETSVVTNESRIPPSEMTSLDTIIGSSDASSNSTSDVVSSVSAAKPTSSADNIITKDTASSPAALSSAMQPSLTSITVPTAVFTFSFSDATTDEKQTGGTAAAVTIETVTSNTSGVQRTVSSSTITLAGNSTTVSTAGRNARDGQLTSDVTSSASSPQATFLTTEADSTSEYITPTLTITPSHSRAVTFVFNTHEVMFQYLILVFIVANISD